MRQSVDTLNAPAKLSLSRNQLKYLVIAAMCIDHIAWAFVPTASLLGQGMHFIGRLTGPTMAYFIAEGYCYTRSVKKYALRLGIFALLSWPAFVYFEFGTLPVVIQDGAFKILPYFGVLYTLLLSLLAVWLWDRGRCAPWLKYLGIIGLCALSLVGDWPIFDILFALTFFCYRDKPMEKWVIFCTLSLLCCISSMAQPWWTGLYLLGLFLVPPLIQFGYNGKSGSKKPLHKWFFYVFYPAHLLLLGVLRWVLFAS